MQLQNFLFDILLGVIVIPERQKGDNVDDGEDFNAPDFDFPVCTTFPGYFEAYFRLKYFHCLFCYFLYSKVLT